MSSFWLSSFCYPIIYVCGTSSHTAVFVDKRKITRKICWDENCWVNSFKKNLVVRTTRPQFLVVLTYFLVAEDARTLEFCYPALTVCCMNKVGFPPDPELTTPVSCVLHLFPLTMQ